MMHEKVKELLSKATVAERDASQYEVAMQQLIQQIEQQEQNQPQQPQMQLDKDMQEWNSKNAIRR